MKSYIAEKFKIIDQLIKGKSVLDIGCVQHNWEKSDNDTWVHKHLYDKAVSVCGIDILEHDVNKLNEIGYSVKVANAEDFDLGIEYDTIYAGEIVEHLANFEGFLKSCQKHLKPDGRLIITVPNCWSLLFMLLTLINKMQVNDEHTCWFDLVTLSQLLERFNFKIDKAYYLHQYAMSEKYRTIKTPIKNLLSAIFNKLCPYRLRDTIMVVATKDEMS